MAKKRAKTKATTRGPMPGKGGRPTAASKRKRNATAAAHDVDEFAESLTSLTFQDLKTLAGSWRPLATQDAVVLSQFWDSIQRYRELAEYVGSRSVDDWTFTLESGYSQQIPQIGLLNAALKQCHEFAAKFGMTPGDRARLGDPPATPTDKSTPFATHQAKVEALSAEVRH